MFFYLFQGKYKQKDLKFCWWKYFWNCMSWKSDYPNPK